MPDSPVRSVPGSIHAFESFGAVDGPGVRYVVFFQGCPLRCLYCHNPDAQPRHAGTRLSSAAVFRKILRNRNFLSKGGVTLSGGEPALQRAFALDLLRRCRNAGIHTALDTSGAIPLPRSRALLDEADLILLDIKALDPLLCKTLTGQDCLNALATLAYCETIHKPVWIRHVLVPGLTLNKNHLHELAEFLSIFRCIQRVDLLPYHKMGEHKWPGRAPFADLPEPSPSEVKKAEEVFADAFAENPPGFRFAKQRGIRA